MECFCSLTLTFLLKPEEWGRRRGFEGVGDGGGALQISSNASINYRSVMKGAEIERVSLSLSPSIYIFIFLCLSYSSVVPFPRPSVVHPPLTGPLVLVA